MEVLSSRVLLAPSDLQRSIGFYRDTLGLRVYREFGRRGEVTGVVFFMGGGLLELSRNGGSVLGTPPQHVRLWLQVPDVDREVARLREAGVPVLAEPETRPWGLREAEVTDPDGFVLVLVQVPDDHPLRRRLD
jgi:catechol 2,3-dioxygenase-like lactoylglutathione lyase family enzyme